MGLAREVNMETATFRRRITQRTGFLLLALFVLAQTAYATWLNWFLYRRTGPFFDSMAYANTYADILTLSREAGIVQGLRAAFHAGTVSLPWIFTALLSPVLPYSRYPGIWFQELWMLALAASVFLYLTRYRVIAPGRAVCLTLPFLAFRVVFAANGGISDFRMDLMLYLLLAGMAVWYLASYETDSWVPWALSGAFLLLATLNRATAPVYIAVMFGPLLVVRLFLAGRQDAVRLVRRLLVFWFPAVALGGLSLFAKYSYLHYYYFVWGADPNANLPLWKALMHIAFAGWSIGLPLTLVAVPAVIVEMRERLPRYGTRLQLFRALDWRVLWLGTAPVLMLVLRGAGPNTLASMPAIFGWLLFCLLPFRDSGKDTPRQRKVAWLLAAACAMNFAYGSKLHAYPPGSGPGMQAIRSGIQRMHDDAVSRGKVSAGFATAHILEFHETAIRNVLIFEFGSVPHGGRYPYGGVTFFAVHAGAFGAAVPVAWQSEVPGRDEEQRLRNLVQLALRDAGYFFLPDDRTLDWMEQNRAGITINLKTRAFKRLLLATGRWEQLGAPLVASSVETVVLYRKREEPLSR